MALFSSFLWQYPAEYHPPPFNSKVQADIIFLALNHIVMKGVLKSFCSKKGAVPVFLGEASQNLQNCLARDLHEFIRSFPKCQFGGKGAADCAGPAAIR